MLIIAVAAAALSACQKPATPTASAPSAETAAPSLAGPPHRRAGLWQTSLAVNGKAMPMGSMKLCVDEAMEAKSSAFHPSGPASLAEKAHCDYPPPTRGLDGTYSFSATCPLPGGGQAVTKGSASGDWSSAYHVHIENDTTGAAAANGHHVTDLDGKWLGPCPPGMAGGDMEMGNGLKISGGKLAGAAAMLKGMTGGGSSSGGGQ
jgi:hypothetical protein